MEQKYLFIDTCVWRECKLNKPENLKALIWYLRYHNIILLSNFILEKEVEHAEVKKGNKCLDDVFSFLTEGHKQHCVTVQKICAINTNQLKVNYENLLTEAFTAKYNNTLPFEEDKKHEFPDFFTVKMLKHFIEQHKSKVSLAVWSNDKGFCGAVKQHLDIDPTKVHRKDKEDNNQDYFNYLITRSFKGQDKAIMKFCNKATKDLNDDETLNFKAAVKFIIKHLYVNKACSFKAFKNNFKISEIKVNDEDKISYQLNITNICDLQEDKKSISIKLSLNNEQLEEFEEKFKNQDEGVPCFYPLFFTIPKTEVNKKALQYKVEFEKSEEIIENEDQEILIIAKISKFDLSDWNPADIDNFAIHVMPYFNNIFFDYKQLMLDRQLNINISIDKKGNCEII